MSKSQSFSINQKVNSLLAAERKAKGVTQAELAAKLKKPQSFVSKYEGGQRQLTVANYAAVCKALGIKPEKILNRLS